MSAPQTPETDNEAYMVECTSVQNYGIEDPSEVVDADFARNLERRCNELMAALKGLLSLDDDHQRGADDQDVCIEVQRARAAIVKVEGLL